MRHSRSRFVCLHSALTVFAIGLCATGAGAASDCLGYLSGNPQMLYENASGTSSATAVDGDRAYVAVPGGIRVFDVSVPAQSTALGLVPVSGAVSDLTIDAGVLYICVSNFGLRIASLSSGELPTIVAEVALPQGARDIALRDGVACVAAGASGLKIYDVDDPAAPLLLATVGGASVYHVTRNGDWIYGGCGVAGVLPVGIVDPAHPVVAPLWDAAANVTCLAVHDGDLYVGTADARVLSCDLTNPASPALLDALQLPDFPTSMASRSDGLWLSAIATGLVAVDTGNPSDLAVRDLVEMPGFAYEVEHAGARTYLAGSNELRILDLATPTPDATLGWYHAPNGLSDVAVAGSRAYALDYFEGLITLDVTDPLRPVEIDRLQLPGESTSIVVDGDHAYIASSTAGVSVIDLTEADHPELAAVVPLSGSVQDVAISGNRLVATVSNGSPDHVAVVDVADWRAPVPAGTVAVFNPQDIAVAGSLAGVVSNGSLQIVDFSQPATPVIVGAWQPASTVTGLAMTPGLAVVCEADGALTALDLTDAADPTAIGGCATVPWTSDLLLVGDVAYLAAELHGVVAVDLADPAAPGYLGAAMTAGSIERVRLAGNFIYAITPEEGLSVTAPVCRQTAADAIPAGSLRAALSACPNPFNPRTSIIFELPSDATVSVDIVDLRGRRVRCLLATTTLDAGSHTVAWDGRDDRGHAQSAGVYLARLAAGSDVTQAKVTLLK
jgi:hypothetical protein